LSTVVTCSMLLWLQRQRVPRASHSQFCLIGPIKVLQVATKSKISSFPHPNLTHASRVLIPNNIFTTP
jgi:hypothetical protein